MERDGEKPTSFPEQVHVSLISLLTNLLACLFQFPSFVPCNGSHNVERSAVQDKVLCQH